MGATSSRPAAGTQVVEQQEGKGQQHALRGQQECQAELLQQQQEGSDYLQNSQCVRMKCHASATLFSRLQVPYEDVCFVKQIGKGSSKTVYLGTWAGTQVAVCSLRRGGRMMEVHGMAQLVQAGVLSHPNLAQFYRWCGDSQGNEYLLMEYVQLGSLDRLLRASGSYLQLSAKVSIAEQICSAMCVLMEAGILHKDLSARNILVHTLNPVHIKVADFGAPECASTLSQQQGIRQQTRPGAVTDLLPMRWCPPEVLLRLEWSEKSDVWAYGVTLWEVFANGAEPYAPSSDEQVVKQVLQHKLLPWPEGCPIQMYRLMLLCWAADPQDRPRFSEIAQLFKYWRSVGSSRPGKASTTCVAPHNMQIQPGNSSRQEPHPMPQPTTDEWRQHAGAVHAVGMDNTTHMYGPCAVLVPGPPPDWVRPYDAPGTYLQQQQQQQQLKLKPSKLVESIQQLQNQQQDAATAGSNTKVLLAGSIADLMDDCMAQYFAPTHAYIQPHISRSSQCMYQTIVLNPNAQGGTPSEQLPGLFAAGDLEPQPQQGGTHCVLAYPPTPAAPTAAASGQHTDIVRPAGSKKALAQLVRTVAGSCREHDVLLDSHEQEMCFVDSSSSWETADSQWENRTATASIEPQVTSIPTVATDVTVADVTTSSTHGMRGAASPGNSSLVTMLHQQLCRSQQMPNPSLPAEQLLQAAGVMSETAGGLAMQHCSTGTALGATQNTALNARHTSSVQQLTSASFTATDSQSAAGSSHDWLQTAKLTGGPASADMGRAGPVPSSFSHSSTASNACQVSPEPYRQLAQGVPCWPPQTRQASAATHLGGAATQVVARGQSYQPGLAPDCTNNSIAALTSAAADACCPAHPTLLAAVAEFYAVQPSDQAATAQQHMPAGQEHGRLDRLGPAAVGGAASVSLHQGMYQRPRQVLSCAAAAPPGSRQVTTARSTSSGYMSVQQLQELCKQLPSACTP